MNTYRIWISYHKDELVNQYNLKEDETHKLFATHHAVEGNNINHLNSVYSEMVTMWYVWKNNIKSPYIGFNHYRRQFNVSKLPKKGECQVYDIMTFGLWTVYDLYAHCHNSKDMDIMISLLDNKYGLDNEYSKYIKESHELIPNCCFLMKWSDFIKLCEFMFPLLEEFSDIIKCHTVLDFRNKAFKDFGSISVTYQARLLSFLAERLISAWITKNMKYYINQ